MPAFIAALLGGLINIVGTMVGRVLVSLGLSVVTVTGMSAGLGWAKANALQAFGRVDPQIVGMLSALGVGNFISIVCSALVARLALAALGSDTVKQWVKK